MLSLSAGVEKNQHQKTIVKRQFKYHFFKVKTEPEVLKKKTKIRVLKGSSKKIRTPSD